MKLVENTVPMPARANAPRNILNLIDDLVAVRGLLLAEQAATAADRQKMIEAAEDARGVINRTLDGLIQLLSGSMDERLSSGDAVIGGPG